MAIILQMRERMEEMQRQIQEFVQYIQQEVLTRANAAADPVQRAQSCRCEGRWSHPAVQPGRKKYVARFHALRSSQANSKPALSTSACRSACH